MKTDEGFIFRAHRKRLAREAKALIAAQASMKQSFTPTGPPPPSVPTVNENGELIWEEPQSQSKSEPH